MSNPYSVWPRKIHATSEVKGEAGDQWTPTVHILSFQNLLIHITVSRHLFPTSLRSPCESTRSLRCVSGLTDSTTFCRRWPNSEDSTRFIDLGPTITLYNIWFERDIRFNSRQQNYQRNIKHRNSIFIDR